MASFQPKQILVHLTLVQSLHAQTIQNGYYFSNRDAMSDVGLDAVIGQLISHFTLFILPYIKQIQSQEVVYRAMVASVLIPHNGPIFEQVLETSQGDQVDESLPSYCAACLTLRSGFGGKSNRGRSYYSGIIKDAVSSSRVNSGLLTQLQNLGNQLIGTFGDFGGISPFVYCIYSRAKGDTEGGRPTSVGIVAIKQAIARSVMCTQRHRKIGIGN